MNRGYRLNNSIALANYYADVNNMANFAADPGGALVVDPRSRYGASSMAEDAYNQSVQRDVATNPYRTAGRSIRQGASRAAYGAGQGVRRAGRAVGQGASRAAMLARRNPLAAGAAAVAGVGALGAAGYGAYRATRPEDEQY